MYVYSISYFHSMGVGCSQVFREKKINSIKEYNSVRRFIEKQNNLKNVAIINFQLICRTREGKNEHRKDN